MVFISKHEVDPRFTVDVPALLVVVRLPFPRNPFLTSSSIFSDLVRMLCCKDEAAATCLANDALSAWDLVSSGYSSAIVTGHVRHSAPRSLRRRTVSKTLPRHLQVAAHPAALLPKQPKLLTTVDPESDICQAR